MADDIRVGVIGFGLAGRIFHTAVVAATPGLELAVIVQRSGDEAAKAYPGVRIARSIEEMLDDPSIMLVVVGTPSYSHFEIAEQCLRAGRNVVIDKPFTLTSDEARLLIGLARERRLLLTAYQNRRWDGDFVTLKQVLASGELGRIVSYESHFDRYRSEPRRDVWRESGGPGGGILFDLGPHLIDQATTLFGDPANVFADVRIDRETSVTDDAFDIQLKAGMKFGDAGFGEDPENLWGELYIAGRPVERVKTAAGDYRGLYANVRDALLGVGELEVKPEQAWRTTRLIELCRDASGHGRRIEYKGSGISH
jgi:predicted dehydrogenase